MGSLYTPLDATKRQFRLVRLVQEPWTLRLKLAVFSLDDEPTYKALSYRWASPIASYRFSLNGHHVNIRANLHGFLTNYRSDGTDAWLFIDAICINQNDMAERSAQVALMGDLYREAQEVIAWVDLAHPTAYTSSSAFNQASFDRATEILGNSPRHLIDTEFAKAECRHQKLREELDVLALLYPILSQPYWTRLWVVQEILLAQRVTIHFGSIRTDLSTIAGCLDAEHKSTHAESASPLTDHTHWISLSGSASCVSAETMMCFAAQDIITEKVFWQQRSVSDRRIGISRALTHFPIHECSVRHDHVFALLEMTGCPLKPDYSTKLIDLYVHVFVWGCLELWRESSDYQDMQERQMRTQLFNQATWKAIFNAQPSMAGWARPAATLVVQTAFAIFGCQTECDLDGPDLMPRGSIYKAAITAFRRRRSLEISHQLKSMALQNESLLVPDANGMPESIPYSVLVGKVETAYDKLFRDGRSNISR